MEPWRSKKYRDAGKGEPCAFRCGRDTVEGAHIRLAGFCGTGQKPVALGTEFWVRRFGE